MTIVAEVKRYVDDELYKAGFLGSSNVVVEIIDGMLLRPKTIGPILKNERLEAEWPIIQGKVFSILESSGATKGAMNTIAIFRYGRSADSSKNPITVYISLDPGTPDSNWPQVLSRIRAYLNTLSHKLEVHMEHNTLDVCAFDLLPPDSGALRGPAWPAYEERANFGAEIGPSLYILGGDGNRLNSGFGTLGCYVELKTESAPAWKRYALTNYHVVRPCFEGFSIYSERKRANQHWLRQELQTGGQIAGTQMHMGLSRNKKVLATSLSPRPDEPTT